MKKRQAEKAVEVVRAEITKICDEHDAQVKELMKDMNFDSDPMERCVVVEVSESESCKGEFCVEVRTDSDVYDLIYALDCDYGYNEKGFTLRKRIEDAVDKALKFEAGEHYFEHYGGGILHLY